MPDASSATLAGMFAGFWGWPLSQKVFGLLWLAAVAFCAFSLAAILYASS